MIAKSENNAKTNRWINVEADTLSASLPRAAYSPREFVSVKPYSGSYFPLNSVLPLGRARLLFSKRPIYLRRSALRPSSTVPEIPTFRRVYGF